MLDVSGAAGEPSAGHAGLRHVRPRIDRVSDHACCAFLRSLLEELVS